ncbi:retrovirus-related pol polyprotein from transposon TNT 1-94 [Tanacetum coccineum]
MSGTLPPPPVTSSRNAGNPNRVEDVFQTDKTNIPSTNNVAQNVVNEDLPQLLDSRRGSHVTNVPPFDVDDFTSWKDWFLVYLDGLEPYLFEILENGPYVPKSSASTSENILIKLQKHYEGPSDIRDTKIIALRLKFNDFKALEGEKVKAIYTRLNFLLNELENKDVKIPQAEVNATFVNSLPKKMANDSDVEEDTKSSSEFLVDLNVEFHDITLLENQKRFYKRSRRVGLARKPMDKSNETCFAWVTMVKAFMAITEDEHDMGKTNARFNQWVEITMKKRKNLLSMFNSFKQELSSCKSELTDLKNTKAHNISLQNNITRLILDNESLKDEVSDLKMVEEEPLPPKILGAEPIDTSNDVIPLADVIQTSTVSDKTKQIAEKESSLKAQSSVATSSRKALKILKPCITCKYCGFYDHHSDECEYCMDVTYVAALLMNPLTDYLKRFVWYLDSGCSRHMTEIKQYLHKYSKELGPKVEFGDNINQLCDANFKVLFTKTLGTIFNQNNEVVLIAPRRIDVYVIDMSSYNEESNTCFFAKVSNNVNWMWHKRLSHLNFRNINTLSKQNLVAGLPSHTFSKEKPCSACEKGKHHRASFKIKILFFINKCLHLLMDLFGPLKLQTISQYTLVIVDKYSRKMENHNEVRVKELRSDNRTKFRNHKVEEFCNKKGISQNFSSPCAPEQNLVAERRYKTLIEAARTIKQEMEETYHVTFNEAAEVITQTNTEGDEINFNGNRSFPDDEFLVPRNPSQSITNDDFLPYVLAFDPFSTNNIIIPNTIISSTLNINSSDESS